MGLTKADSSDIFRNVGGLLSLTWQSGATRLVTELPLHIWLSQPRNSNARIPADANVWLQILSMSSSLFTSLCRECSMSGTKEKKSCQMQSGAARCQTCPRHLETCQAHIKGVKRAPRGPSPSLPNLRTSFNTLLETTISCKLVTACSCTLSINELLDYAQCLVA